MTLKISWSLGAEKNASLPGPFKLQTRSSILARRPHITPTNVVHDVPMRYVLIVALWASFLGAVWLGLRTALHSQTRPNATPADPVQRTETIPPDESAPLRTVALGATKPLPAVTQHQRLTTAETQDAPTPAEEQGSMRHLYAHFVAEQLDTNATRDAERYFGDAFQQNDIAPTARHIACTASLCRTRFSFPDLDAMRRLAKLKRDESIQSMVGDPLMSDEGATIVIYFATRGHVLPSSGGG